MVKRTKTIISLLFISLLTVNLTACKSQETTLLAGYCEYYADGGLYNFVEYTYECDKYDYKDPSKKLDERAYIVY